MKIPRYLLLNFLLFCQFVISQEYDFKSFTTEDGLLNNTVFKIIQAQDHNIWIATLGGVQVFNGTTFKNYTKKDGLASNLIHELFEDSKGRIWVGTIDNGISIIENENIQTPPEISSFEYGAINRFFETSDGSIYIFTNVAILKFKDDSFTVLDKKSEEKNNFSISDVIQFDDNTLYLSSLSKGVYKMTLAPFSLEIINSETHGINNICYSLFKDKNNAIWIGSYGALYKFQNDTITTYIPNKNAMDTHRIWSIIKENENVLLVAFEGNGIAYFDKNTGVFTINNASNGLPSNYVYSLLKDKEQNIWMTTYDKGIIRYKDNAFSYWNHIEALSNKEMYNITFWNTTWTIATNKGVLLIKNDNLIKTLFQNTVINFVKKTASGNLIVSTPSETYLVDKAYNIKLLEKGFFYDVYIDDNTQFFISPERLKVRQKDTTYERRFRRSFKTLPIGDRYIFAKLYALLQFKDGQLDTIPGLHPSTYKTWRAIETVNKNEVFAVNDDLLVHIRLDSILNVTKYPLDRFKPLQKIRALAVHDNFLWLKSKDTYSKLAIESLLQKDSIIITHYKNTSGFIPNEDNMEAINFDDNGNLVTPSTKGLFSLQPKHYKNNTTAPQLALANVSLFAEPLIDSLYQKNNELILPYDQNYLTFTMEAITFSNAEDVQFKYRLKGLREGNTWSIPSQKNEVVYSYLPPGNYTFEFTANNGNGIWQEEPYVYTFKIAIPFWRTSLFWFIVLTSLGSIAFLFLYLRNKTIQKRQQKFAQDLINAQEAERKRISRELHDSIGQKLLLLKNKILNKESFTNTNLVDETISEVREMSQNLHPFQFEKLGLITSIKNLVATFQKNSEIFYSDEIDVDYVEFEREKSIFIYRMIQECLSNVEKHSKAKACKITILKQGDTFIFEVKDNGIGFETVKAKEKIDSLGMKTLFERAAFINARLMVQSIKGKETSLQIHVS